MSGLSHREVMLLNNAAYASILDSIDSKIQDRVTLGEIADSTRLHLDLAGYTAAVEHVEAALREWKRLIVNEFGGVLDD